MVDLTFQTNKIQPIHFNMTNKTSQNKVKKRTEQKREEKRATPTQVHANARNRKSNEPYWISEIKQRDKKIKTKNLNIHE